MRNEYEILKDILDYINKHSIMTEFALCNICGGKVSESGEVLRSREYEARRDNEADERLIEKIMERIGVTEELPNGCFACYANGARQMAIEKNKVISGLERRDKEYVLAQICPRCNGEGRVIANPGCTTALYKQCEVCKGAQIIPMLRLKDGE